MILADEAFDGTSGNFLDLYWMLGDHQGSVTSVLSHNSGQTSVVQQLARRGSIAALKDANKDSRAMVSREQKAHAFGSIGSIEDGQGNNVTTGPISRFAYTGREFDPETGDYYYRARYYDPQSGRFLSQDPIGFAAGDMNLYRYVGNSSPNWVDPSGLRADGMMVGQQPRPNVPIGPARYNDGSGPSRMLPGFTPPGGDQSNYYWRTNGFGDPVLDPTIIIVPPGPVGGPIMIVEPPATGPRPEPVLIPDPRNFPGMTDPNTISIGGGMTVSEYLELIPGIGDIGGVTCSVLRGDGEGVLLAAVPFVPTRLAKRIKQGIYKLYQGSDGKIPQVVIKHLWDHNRIDEIDIGERIHRIKFDNGKCAADNVLIHLSGDVFDEKTGEFLGSLTQGGGSRGRQ